MRLLRVRPVRASEGQLYRGGRCLYLVRLSVGMDSRKDGAECVAAVSPAP